MEGRFEAEQERTLSEEIERNHEGWQRIDPGELGGAGLALPPGAAFPPERKSRLLRGPPLPSPLSRRRREGPPCPHPLPSLPPAEPLTGAGGGGQNGVDPELEESGVTAGALGRADPPGRRATGQLRCPRVRPGCRGRG